MPLPRHDGWTVARVVPLLAGLMVLLSTALAAIVSPWWLILTAFVGANLVFYAAVGWCPASLVMQRFGVPATCAALPRTRPE